MVSALSECVLSFLRVKLMRFYNPVVHFMGVYIVLGIFGGFAAASVDVSLRVLNSLKAQSDQVRYITYLSDCTDLISTQITAGDDAFVLSPSDGSSVAETPLACEYEFTATGSGRFNPILDFTFRDQTQHNLTAVFQIDSVSPDLSFNDIAIKSVNGQQALFISVNTTATDINAISFSVLGLRASDLRKFGGVIDKIKENGLAFADTDGVKNLFP
ncbi:hypothetical protein MNBD_GAMMA11-194, partial [hydrothermal vent metagenome]